MEEYFGSKFLFVYFTCSTMSKNLFSNYQKLCLLRLFLGPKWAILMFLAQNLQNIESIPLSLEFYGGATGSSSSSARYKNAITSRLKVRMNI
jgi:hypothetical protein